MATTDRLRRWVLGGLFLVAAGCSSARKLPPAAEAASCLGWREDLEARVGERCVSCHGGAAPAGTYDLSSYLGAMGGGSDAVPNVLAGDGSATLLAYLDPSTADETHKEAGKTLLSDLRRWNVDCRLAYTRSPIHPAGILNPADPDQFHGKELRKQGYRFELCAKCHGSDFSGGKAQVACTSCHVEGPTACSTCHGESLKKSGSHRAHLDGTGHAAKLDCTVCHQRPTAYTDVGHILLADGTVDQAPAEVRLAGLAIQGHTDASFDPSSKTCAGTYCHGGDAPAWGSTIACGSCHTTPPASHGKADQCDGCHPSVAKDAQTIVGASLHVNGKIDYAAEDAVACTGCHAQSPETGAHKTHTTAGPRHAALACTDCHVVPRKVDDAGHILRADGTVDEPPADVTFGALAGLGAKRTGPPAYEPASRTCTNVYCHGGASGDASATSVMPKWEAPTSTAVDCASCHGKPPASHQGEATVCVACHPAVAAADGMIATPALHANGRVDLGDESRACTGCHGAPPETGAHKLHTDPARIGRALACQECHTTPERVRDAGHILRADGTVDGLPAEITFGALANASPVLAPRAAPAAWDAATKKCGNVYCHGATLPGKDGRTIEPAWTDAASAPADTCTSCHGMPPRGHTSTASCATCHGDVVDAANHLTDASLHMNGRVDLSGGGNVACTSCHGKPPQTGAHVAHTSGAHGKALACTDCHQVPLVYTDVGHIFRADGTLDLPPAEVRLGARAVSGARTPAYDAATGTCATVYCHDAGGQSGAVAPAPAWTGGAQAVTCGNCHALPPPSHGSGSDCSRCHPSVVDQARTITRPDLHVDGVVQTADATSGCVGCHGQPPTTGSHVAHARSGALGHPIACTECHTVPAQVTDAGHIRGTDGRIDGQAAELTFGALASASPTAYPRTAAPAYANGRCSNVYCHGATIADNRASNTFPTWGAGSAQAACGTCHGLPPQSHTTTAPCSTCHAQVIDQSGQFVRPDLHMDGRVQLDANIACTTCHGQPPATGAHAAHNGASQTARVLQCVECHTTPSLLTDAGHIYLSDGRLDASPAEVTFGALAALTPTGNTRAAAPSWDRTRCSNVYCHGATLGDGRAASTAPAWVAGTLGCTSCHGAPPASHTTTLPCAACHSQVVAGSTTIRSSTLHINGIVEVGAASASCTDCHGGALGPAPPRDLLGNTDASAPGVGMHQSHLQSARGLMGTFQCSTCHVVPGSMGAAGHIDRTAGAEVVFSGTATADSAAPVYNRTSATCSNVYCHGNGTVLSQDTAPGLDRTPSWTTVGAATCGRCHGVPPVNGRHPAATFTQCVNCHPRTVDGFANILVTGPAGARTSFHMNGVVDVGP